MDEFIVARNPNPASRLPYLIRLPIDGGTWLKAKESWPRAARVYCHPAEAVEVAAAEILERIVVVACVRRGPAIDLVLARGNNKRAQFVFTTYRGRPMIFWQTPKVAAAARPGLRVPFTRATGDETIYVDSRERYGYKFAAHAATLTRRALPVGDYATEIAGKLAAAVERKTLDDLLRSLNDGTLNYAMAELSSLPAAAVVVEGTYSALLRHQYTRPGFLADLVARLQIRYPSVPILFLESRKVAEEWTFRFLCAAGSGVQPALSALTPPEAPKRRERKKRAPAATAEE